MPPPPRAWTAVRKRTAWPNWRANFCRDSSHAGLDAQEHDRDLPGDDVLRPPVRTRGTSPRSPATPPTSSSTGISHPFSTDEYRTPPGRGLEDEDGDRGQDARKARSCLRPHGSYILQREPRTLLDYLLC